MKIPVIDLEDCSDCDACIECCPEIFQKNDLGLIVVKELKEYDEEMVNDIIRNCPGSCIRWEEE